MECGFLACLFLPYQSTARVKSGRMGYFSVGIFRHVGIFVMSFVCESTQKVVIVFPAQWSPSLMLSCRCTA